MVVHEELGTLVELFGEVALSDPLSFLLVALGALVIGASSGVFGYLSLRAALSVFGPNHGEGTPQQGQ